MARSDTTRLEKLHGLLARLKRGENVQNRQLQTWLGEEGFKAFKDSWSNVVDLRNMLTTKPGELAVYEELLKKAIMLYNRGEAASAKGQASARRFHSKAQAAFERALLSLEEMMGQDPSLQMWLDRHCDFTAEGTLSLDPIGMPRVADRARLGEASIQRLIEGFQRDGVSLCIVRHYALPEIRNGPEPGDSGLRAALARHALPVVDLRKHFPPGIAPETFFRDDIHFNDAGQAILAKAVAECASFME